MNIKKIQELIQQGESNTIEFKTSMAGLSAAFKTICAFLNGEGGSVLIGVSDKGKLIGQDITDNTRQEIARELTKIDPHADIAVTYLPIDGNKQLIAITVKSGKGAPYVYDDRPYLRNQSTTVRMPREKYDRLLYDRKPASNAWEKLTSENISIADLDKSRIQQVVSIAISERRLAEIAVRANVREILKKLNLIVDDKITNAAVILFCKNQQKQFIQSQLRLARFKGIDKSEFIDNKAVHGNVFDLYEHAMDFLQNYLPISGKIEESNPFRVDTLAIPYKVLREALVNALCHRDYSSPGGSISLAIYDDRVEISSSGRLPNDISLKDLTKEHESHPRNPLIANVLFVCKMIERWGRGTQDMVDFCKKVGNPKPKFREMTGSFTVILPLKEPIGGYKEKSYPDLTGRQREMLKLLSESALNSAQIAAKLKDYPGIRMVQIELKKLEKFGLVKREGETRATVWKVTK